MENKENWDFLVWLLLGAGIALFLGYLLLLPVAHYLDKKEKASQ